MLLGIATKPFWLKEQSSLWQDKINCLLLRSVLTVQPQKSSSRWKDIKTFFSSPQIVDKNKLECLSTARIYSLV
jgi:hypothetical protein